MTTRFELGESSNPNPNPASLVTSTATLLECMMVKRVKQSPYKKQGPELPVAIWEGEAEGEGTVYVRLDIPGANYVEVYLDPSEMSINYKGVEEEITMHGVGSVGNCRVYQGSVFFDGSRFFNDDHLDFCYEFSDGVLLFKISCVNPATSADLGVQLMTYQQEMKESSYNPLVTQGTDRHSFYCVNNDGAFVMAVDMPGLCEDDDLKVKVSQQTGRLDFFAAKRVSLSDELYGESLIEPKRVYEGAFIVNAEEFNAKEAEFEINHGVFWIRVPRAVKILVDDCVTVFHDGSMVNFKG